MKQPSKLVFATLVLLAQLCFAGRALAQHQGPGELTLPLASPATTRLKLVGLPELWHEPPASIPMQLRVALPSPLGHWNVGTLAIVHHAWQPRGLWPAPASAPQLSLGLAGPLGTGRLRWLALWKCGAVNLSVPRGPCQLQVGFSLRG